MTEQNEYFSTNRVQDSRLNTREGTVAEPGLVSIAPGSGVTMIDPVSVYLEDGIEYSYRYFVNSCTGMYQQ
jgi:hypothetical protein